MIISKNSKINQGDQYGRLTIIKEVDPKVYATSKARRVEAACQCGNVKKYLLAHLRTGHTTSCGCYSVEKYKEMEATHGLKKHPLFNVWRAMIQRCTNPKCNDFKNYGGRDITVCYRWMDSFYNFYEDMKDGYKKGLDIDRIDNNSGYCPDNCRWVTRSENLLNRRITGSVEYRGVYFLKETGKYAATVWIKVKSKHIGYFPTALEAAKAFDQYVKANNLPNQLNF